MALQGTLETFSLPDVLTLLSSTNKSGCLRLRGDRGVGAVWVTDGGIVSSEADGVPSGGTATDVLFELLRYAEGEFVFDEGEESADPAAPADVAATLAEAQSQIEEWSELEKVVPSGQHFVSLAPEVTGDVTISPDNWKALVVVGSGRSVSSVGEELELGEVGVARLLSDLVGQSLLEIGEPRDEAPAYEPSPEPPPAFEEPSFDDAPPVEPAAEPEPFDPGALTVEPDAAYAEPEPEPEPEAPAPADAAEIARQIANLSPKAARAVAAAAKATTPEEREAALAEVEAADEAINRDLLLKFLGSQS